MSTSLAILSLIFGHSSLYKLLIFYMYPTLTVGSGLSWRIALTLLMSLLISFLILKTFNCVLFPVGGRVSL